MSSAASAAVYSSCPASTDPSWHPCSYWPSPFWVKKGKKTRSSPSLPYSTTSSPGCCFSSSPPCFCGYLWMRPNSLSSTFPSLRSAGSLCCPEAPGFPGCCASSLAKMFSTNSMKHFHRKSASLKTNTPSTFRPNINSKTKSVNPTSTLYPPSGRSLS